MLRRQLALLSLCLIGLLGSLFIFEVADRAAAEELVGNEPMTAGGVFGEVRINRWRYGKSLA